MTALEEALYVYEKRDHLDRQQKFDAAVSLAEWGVYSARHISAIVGLPAATVNKLNSKTDRTGGRFDPAALPHLLRLSQLRRRGEVDVFEAKAALDAGCSVYFAARLTEIPRSTLQRYYNKAEELGA